MLRRASNAEAVNAIVVRAERSGAQVSGGRADRPIDFRRSRSSRRSSPAPRGLPTSGSALEPSRAGPAPSTLAHAHARHARACARTARSRMLGFCAPSIDRTAVMCADRCVGMRRVEGRRAGACVASHPARWCAGVIRAARLRALAGREAGAACEAEGRVAPRRERVGVQRDRRHRDAPIAVCLPAGTAVRFAMRSAQCRTGSTAQPQRAAT